jgi:hypothetical protein
MFVNINSRDMKNLFTILLLLIITLGLSGCIKTELTGRYENFEGVWNAQGITMTLYKEGRADFIYGPGDKKNITGGRLLIIDYELKILSTFKNLNFNIIEYPFVHNKNQPNEYKTMALSGHYFTTN